MGSWTKSFIHVSFSAFACARVFKGCASDPTSHGAPCRLSPRALVPVVRPRSRAEQYRLRGRHSGQAGPTTQGQQTSACPVPGLAPLPAGPFLPRPPPFFSLPSTVFSPPKINDIQPFVCFLPSYLVPDLFLDPLPALSLLLPAFSRCILSSTPHTHTANMSRRETGGTPSNAPSGRQNEYFVPRDGIDREVITADICRYLGNDALVRPGIYTVRFCCSLVSPTHPPRGFLLVTSC